MGPRGKKPSPAGIVLALEKLGIKEPHLVAYVGDEYTDVVAAYRAKVIPIVPSWASRNSVSTPPFGDLSSAGLIELANEPHEKALFAERCAEHRGTTFDRKDARFLPLDEASDVATIRQKLKVFCLGRYYSQKSVTTAELHDRHPLSLEIAKKDASAMYIPPGWMADMLLKIANSAKLYLFDGKESIDIVTVVPNKPGKHPRLEQMLKQMEELASSTGIKIEFRTDLLYFDTAATSSLRSLSAHERRMEQEQHLHVHPVNLSGKNILIIDDVITTGATIGKAIRLLEQQGASSVHGIGIAKTVSIPEDTKPCPMCHRDMMIMKNRDTGERFWSCSGYFESQACKHTEQLNPILCPLCNFPLRLKRNGRDNSLFYGCSGWNESHRCKYTKKS